MVATGLNLDSCYSNSAADCTIYGTI